MMAKDSNINELLLSEFKKGNRKAFCKLFELYWEPMFVNAKSIVLNNEIAKDIVQNIWIDLWQKRESREIRSFEPYILRAVNNGCIKFLRDNKFKTIQLDIIESLQPIEKSNVENQHNLEKTQVDIENSLNQLSPRCQQIFRLSRIEEFSNEEISLRLGISKRSVENQVSLALKSIKHNLTRSKSSLIILFIFLYNSFL